MTGSGIFSFALVSLGWEHPVRTLIVLWFLLVCPGLATLHVLDLPDAVTGLALVVPLSLSINALVAGSLLYAGLWSPLLALGIVVALTCCVLAIGPLVARQPDRADTA